MTSGCDWPTLADEEPWMQVTSEALLDLAPDALVVVNWTGQPHETHLAMLAEGPLWAAIPAVASGRVVAPAEDVYPSGFMGVAPFLDAVMPLLYPETFPAPLTDAEVAAALEGTAP